MMPGEQRGCVGCHELHSMAPPTAIRFGPTTSADEAFSAALGYRKHQL